MQQSEKRVGKPGLAQFSDFKASQFSRLRAAKLLILPLAVLLFAGCGQEPPAPPVYVSSCEPCHGSGGGGAPVTGDKEEWAIRLAKGKEAVYQLAIAGFEAPVDDEGRTAVMPAKGARNDLSDEEIMAIVDYMIARSQ